MSKRRRCAWRDVRVDLERIVMCAERVIEYTDGSSFGEFVANDLLYDATLRNLEIMGEAAKRVPESIRARFLGVPGATSRDSGTGWRMPTSPGSSTRYRRR